MINLRNTENKNAQSIYGWLEAYNGNFDFLLSLKAQLLTKGYLSDKQLDAAERCRSREALPKLSVVQPKSFSIQNGAVLEVKQSFAKKIAEKNGSSRVFYNFEVLGVVAETAKAFLVKIKASGRVTSHCNICGRTLTDHVSIASGIGPVCAENYGLPYGDAELTKSALEAMTTQEMETETWIPKSTIKNLTALQTGAGQ